MKTTPKALLGCTAFAWVFWAATATAGVPNGSLETRLTAAILGQAAPAENNDSKDKYRQAADLLVRARQAMDENDLAAADALISKAEALNVQYGRFHFGDTPQKARRDLERKRSEASASPAKPSSLFAPFGLGKSKQTPSSDPFAGHKLDSSAPAAASGAVTPLPTVDARSPSGSGTPAPDRPYPVTQPGENEARAPGDHAAQLNPLCEARLALAVGDVRRALDFVQKARAMKVDYRPLDDTPDKVEAAVQKYRELSGLDRSTEAYARAYARNLMDQADALARWGQFDEAERLAERAAGMRITYGPFEQKPQDLLKRIAAARQPAAGRPMAASEPGFATASAPPATMATRQQAVALVRQAREAIAAGDLNRAESLARQADALRLPDGAFAPGEDRPGLVLLDLKQLRQRDSRVVPAAGADGSGRATQALYDQNNDPTRNVPASDDQPMYPSERRMAQAPGQYEPVPAGPPTPPTPGAAARSQTPGMALFQQGEEALKKHDAARAYQFFQQAAKYPNDLDPMTAQRLQDHLQLLSGPAPGTRQPATVVNEAAMRQQLLYRQVAADLAHRESTARAMLGTDPNGALQMLQEARKKVEASALDAAAQAQLLRRADRAIAETRQMIDKNRPQIELAEQNKRIRQDVERGRRVKLEVQEKLAMLIDKFNRLMDEQRYPEAQEVAKQAAELDPNNPVVMQVLWQAKFVNRLMLAKEIQSDKEQGFVDTMGSVDRSSIPFDDSRPFRFPNIKEWKDITGRAKKYAGDRGRQRTEQEIDYREEAPHAGFAAIHQRPLEQGARLPGQAGRGQPVPRSPGAGRGGRDHATPRSPSTSATRSCSRAP